MNRALVYDIEISRAIPPKSGQLEAGVDYCEGWHDHAGMGVAVVGCYDYLHDQYRVFCGDNIAGFVDLLLDRSPLVGFNNISFDNAVLRAAGYFPPDLTEDHCYDILREVWVAEGLGTVFSPKTHGGYGLDKLCMLNFGVGKSGNGAIAPIEWQRGEVGSVVDYCLRDVWLTKRLFDIVLAGYPIVVGADDRQHILRFP